MKTILITLMLFISSITFSQEKDNDAMPYATVDKAPAYPGCENLSGKELQSCTTEKITNFVNTNFDTSLGKKLGISGMTRIVVQFKIDEDGKITQVRSRSLADKPNVRQILETEATRVVKSLPQMQPGQYKNNNVAIMYSLPIQFAVPEKSKKN